MKNSYDKEYFENGISSGVSCYVNYRWLPNLTLPMCESIIDFANIKKSDTILDYGCAKGFIVRAMVELGYDCHGVDISEYAIKNCDPSIRDRVKILADYELGKYDFILCKDVLEHVSYGTLPVLLKKLRLSCKKLFVIVPLGENGKYVIEEYEKDITHVIREDLGWWSRVLSEAGFEDIKSSYRAPGIKDNWAMYDKGNGFFVCA